MGLTLIIVGLLISYFCWVQKRKIDYILRKENHEKEKCKICPLAILPCSIGLALRHPDLCNPGQDIWHFPLPDHDC